MDDRQKQLLLNYNAVAEVLKARRADRGMDFYIPNDNQLKAHKSLARVTAYVGGNRCLGGETKIFDPLQKREFRVDEIDSDFHVWAWNGKKRVITKALKPFIKPEDDLYRIKLNTGQEFTASLNHLILTPYGFRTIFDVLRSYDGVLQESSAEFSRSVRSLDAGCSEKKVPDSRFDYRSLPCFCDGQPLQATGIAEDVLPLRSGALKRISGGGSWQKDGLGNRLVYTRSYQPAFLRPSLDDRNHYAALFFDTLSRVSCKPYKSVYLKHQVVDRSNPESFLRQPSFGPVQSDTHVYSTKPYITSHLAITSIAYLRRDIKYDFEVPVYHNYICAGAVHHNSGKTTWGSMECAMAITKKYPDWYPVSRRFTGPVKIRIATDRYFKIESVIEPKLRAFLPKGEIVRTRRSPQGYLIKVICRDGSSIEFLTMEQDDMAFESQDLDIFWGDEPVDRNKYIATQRGLIDRGGWTILSFTPLIEPWMKDEIVDKEDGKNIAVVYADIRDNRFDIQGNVILKEADIAWFESLLKDDEKETRLHGKFFHLRGMVYPEFTPGVHCITDFEYEPGYPVYCVLDPHDRKPHWLAWFMVDRMNDIYCMYEKLVPQLGNTTKTLAATILATEKYFGWTMVKRLIDPNFGQTNLITTGKTLIQELYGYKCVFTPACDNIETGQLKVKEYLHFDRTRAIDFNNKPKIYFVSGNCPGVVKSLRNLQYQEWVGKTASNKDPKEAVKDLDDHGATLVRYLCISQPQFRMPVALEPDLSDAVR